MGKHRGGAMTIAGSYDNQALKPRIYPDFAALLFFFGRYFKTIAIRADGNARFRMRETPPIRRLAPHLATVGILLAIVLALIGIPFTNVPPHDLIVLSDNDAITRFVSVRDWLAGQAWYDMTLYRVAPPEGVSLHWSRYVDLGLATIIWPLSHFVPMKTAEAAGIVIWPILLQIMMIILSGKAAARLFGPIAGGLAALAVVFWPLTEKIYFGEGRLDHHNVQILLLLVVILSLIGEGSSVRRGAIGGGAAALSLAVGLEALLPLGVAGILLYLRMWRNPSVAGLQPSTFALSMFLGGVLLFVGQTPPSEWMIAYCDELAPPVLALTGIAAAVTVTATVIGRRTKATALRNAVFAVLAVAGGVAVFPVVSYCASGPYGELPVELQEIIATRIVEARPAYRFLKDGPAIFYQSIVPVFFTLTVVTAMWLRARRTVQSDDRVQAAVGVLLVFGWIGLAGSFYQMRLLVLSAPVIPILIGYLVAVLYSAGKSLDASSTASLKLIVAVAMTLLFPYLYKTYLGLGVSVSAEPTDTQERPTQNACRTPEILQSLDVLPPSRILTYLNMGPPIILLTDHSVLAAPYHRSASALGNGILPFEKDRETLLAAIDSGRAEYLVLCRGTGPVDAGFYATELADGARDERFMPVEGAHEALVVLKVMP